MVLFLSLFVLRWRSILSVYLQRFDQMPQRKKKTLYFCWGINRKSISGTLTPCSFVSWSEKSVDCYSGTTTTTKNNKSINTNSWIHSLSISLLSIFPHSRVVYPQRYNWTHGWITKVCATCITATFSSQSPAFDFAKYRYPAFFGKPRD